MAKVTQVNVTLLVKDEIANKNRKKLASDIEAAINGAVAGGRMKTLKRGNVEGVVVTHSPYASEVRAAAGR